jgi:D-alanyl-D-alanine carboxypeptidase
LARESAREARRVARQRSLATNPASQPAPTARKQAAMAPCSRAPILAVPFLLATLCAQQPATPPPAPTPTPAPAAAPAPLAERLRSALHDALGALTPGAQAALVRGDDAPIAVAIGVADRDSKAPMPHDGKLLAGSTGKTFFAALACQLVREQRLDLDRKVATWFGDEPWFAKLPNAADFTVRHLLMHRSGLMRYELDPAFLRELTTKPDRRFTPQEELAFVAGKTARFHAGEGFEYADTNYVLLGLVLEKVTGKPCYEEIARRFLQPLRLQHTVPSVGRRIPGLLQGYAGADNPFGGRDAMLVAGELPFDPAFEGAGGGFATTATDLAKWARALYGGDVLADLRDEVVAGQPAPLGRGTRYGLGVIVDDTPLGPAWGHRGFFPGSMSEMRWFPDHRIAVAILANTSAERRLGRALPECAVTLARIASERATAPAGR